MWILNAEKRRSWRFRTLQVRSTLRGRWRRCSDNFSSEPMGQVVVMEFHSNKTGKPRSCGQKAEREQRKRRRSSEGRYVGESNNPNRLHLRCLLEGEMWGNSSSIEYEPSEGEDEHSDGKLSLESEFIVHEEMWGASYGGVDDAVQLDNLTPLSGEVGSGSSSYGQTWGGQCKSTRSASKGQKMGQDKGKGKAAMCTAQYQQKGPYVRESDIILCSRCALRKLVMVNVRMSNSQRQAVMGTVWRPLLQYLEIGRESHLTLVLIKSWSHDGRPFR